MLILCLVVCLHGGNYPPNIILIATQLNNDNEGIEANFYYLYNSILSYWFPLADGYYVAPQWPIPGSRKTINFAISLTIETSHPLLLVEIKAPLKFQSDSGHNAAICQVIQHLDEIGPNNQHTD